MKYITDRKREIVNACEVIKTFLVTNPLPKLFNVRIIVPRPFPGRNLHPGAISSLPIQNNLSNCDCELHMHLRNSAALDLSEVIFIPSQTYTNVTVQNQFCHNTLKWFLVCHILPIAQRYGSLGKKSGGDKEGGRFLTYLNTDLVSPTMFMSKIDDK